MDIAASTRAALGAVNEDSFITGAGYAAVMDGATAPPDRPSGCVHDVAWLVSRLCAHLGRGLNDRARGLTEVLAFAIQDARDDHASTCDVSHPDSPSSTVTMLRERGDEVEYLALGDSPLVLCHRDDHVEAIVDDRVEHLPSYTYEAVALSRNHPEGFWVASTRPDAAAHALTGRVPRAQLSHALLLTDGASRLVERYGRSWSDLTGLAVAAGPLALIEEVRVNDAAAVTPRGKRFDDATAVLCQIADTSID